MLESEEIILNWLNNELNFVPKIKNISKEFSDGYLFAEILYKIKEIKEDQLKEFKKHTTNKRLMKENFILIKKYFHEKFNLEIRQEECDDIINKDISKAVVILYKLKNAIRFKKINFYNIKTSLNPETIDEINEKVRKIMDYEYYFDIFNKDLLYDIKQKEDTKYDLKSNAKRVTFSDQNLLQSTYSKRFTSSENFKGEKEPDNYSTKINSFLQTRTTDILSKDLNKETASIKLPNIFYSTNQSNKTRGKRNLLITDFNTISNTTSRIKFGNGKSNIAEEDKFRVTNLTENLFKLGVNDFQFNFKHTLPVFNPQNTRELEKVRKELKNKIREMDEEKKQRSYKKNLQIRLYDVPEIDFRSNNKNNKASTKEKTITGRREIRLIPLEKMKRYCKEWFLYTNQRKMEKKIKYFASLIKKFNLTQEKKENLFNDEQYLSSLNVNDIENLNKILQIKKKKNKIVYPLMNKIFLVIIDMAMEIFFYQEEKETNIIDVETYTKFLELFIDDKPMRERVDFEARLIKEKNKDDIDINVDKLILNSEEQDSKEDYKNYIGFWNSNIIMERKFKGMKIDIKKLRNYLPSDYEPTESEIEDLTLPMLKEDNFLFGDLVLELLDNKFHEKNEVKEKGKWDYIGYKISLIGLPFCGKNFIAEEIKKKYPKMKIYSLSNILRNYCNEYKTITEPVSSNPKFKSMKSNQIELLKQEKENKLKEFEPKLKLIQPYLDLIKNETKIEDKDNENKNSIIMPTDETLLNILIYNIENDFKKMDEEEQKKEIINEQNNINNLIKQKENLEKQIHESKKPNPKDEQNLLNLEKEIEKEKNNTVKGFILVDFPTNIKQCNLLEYYLNGYVDVTNLPKSQKMKNIEKINNLIDFNFQPIEGNKTQKAGIDFIINIITNEDLVNNRFNKKKYDPLNDKIYSEYELSQETIIKDKKLMERLEVNIPYYTKEHFDFYKNQYNENISKICTFYRQFGIPKNNSNFESNFNVINLENSDKDINRTYQEINIAEQKDMNESEEENIIEEKIEEKGKKSLINKEQLIMINKENEIKDKIFNYVNDFIQFLYKEKEEHDKTIYLNAHPEMVSEDKDEEKDRIQFDPDFKVNEIRDPSKSRKDIINVKQYHFFSDNFDLVLSDLIEFNTKYEKYISKFIYLIEKQRKDVYSRLLLIQKKYRDFLNLRSDKRKAINIFCEKYNSFFTEYPSAFNSVLAINDFNEDIDRLNSALWSLINLKETVSIKELQEIKNSNFIEHELKKFYKIVKDLFLLETERFLQIIKCIINLCNRKKNEENIKKNIIKHNDDINNKNNNNNNNRNELKKMKIKPKTINEKEDIFTDIIEIPDEYVIENENDDISNPQNKRLFPKKKENQNDLDYVINQNIHIIFNNCLDLILSQQEKIDSLLKSLKELVNPNVKKSVKLKKKQAESMTNSVMSTYMQTKDSIGASLDENIKKMFDKEKNKYKYRLCFLCSFVSRYIIIINQISKKVFANIDNWIITSVSLQSEARKLVINKLKSLLKEKKLINEEKDIDHIELDTFGETNEKEKNNENKIYTKFNFDYLINDDFINIIIKEERELEEEKKLRKMKKIVQKNYKIIVPDEYESDKINGIKRATKLSDKFYEIDFVFNTWKFNELYNKVKTFEVKKNVISQEVFYENFVKKYLFIKDNSLNFEANNNQEQNNLNKNYFKSNRIVFQKTNSHQVMNSFPTICNALKSVTSKNIKKLFSFFQIDITNPANEEQNLDNEEFDKYLDTSKIFIIFALIGVEILTDKREKDLMNDLKLRLVKNKFLPKHEFLKYKFWFESNFKFSDASSVHKKISLTSITKTPRKIVRQKTKNFTNSPFKNDRKNKEEEQKNFNIKNMLYNILEDEKENMFNFSEFIDILRASNYTKDSEKSSEIYFDVIFGD